jgi:hypothetical protein
MDVHQLLGGPRGLEQGVTACGHLAQAHAHGQDQIGLADAAGQGGVDADAHVARVQRVVVVEGVLEAEPAAHGQLPVLGKALQRLCGLRRPAAAARDHERPLRGHQHGAQVAHPARRRPRVSRLGTRQDGRVGQSGEHVFRQGQHHRAGPTLHRGVEGPRHVLRQAVGVLHLRHPLGQPQGAGAEHLAVVHLLEGLAIALVAGHLAHEEDHGCGVLKCSVHANAGVGGAGPAGDKTDAGPPAQLALGLGHEGRTTLLTAGDEADVVPVFMKAIQHRQIALAGHAKAGVHALCHQGLHESVACHAGGWRGGVLVR